MYRIYKGDGCAAAVTDEMGIAFYKSDISMTCVLWNAEGETIAAARAYDDGTGDVILLLRERRS